MASGDASMIAATRSERTTTHLKSGRTTTQRHEFGDKR